MISMADVKAHALNSICHSCDHLNACARSCCILLICSSVAAGPKIFVSSANLRMPVLIFSSISLMYTMNSVSPNTDPWGTPLVTGCHGDCLPCIVTRCFLPVSQLSIHLIIVWPNPWAPNLDMRRWCGSWDLVERLADDCDIIRVLDNAGIMFSICFYMCSNINLRAGVGFICLWIFVNIM